ncbi:hypothetical protein [Cytobacillus horneckiae]|uniref:hypothetical protein n=1 Tax=Cytobacillus horneckiae TaxID=549687 RepID=UPI003D2401C5
MDIKTLKSLYKNEYYNFLKSLEYKNVEKHCRGRSTYDYSALINYLDLEIKKDTSKLDKEKLETFFYNKLFFNKNNYHYIYNLSSFLAKDSKLEYKEIEKTLLKPELKLNNYITDVSPSTAFELCSTKVITFNKDNKTYVSNLQCIFFIEELEFKTKGSINLFCCVDINFNSKFVSFKFDHKLIEHYDKKVKVLSKIVNKLESDFDVFGALKLKINSHNEAVIRKTIQNLFIELSDQAEKLLQEQVDPEVEKKISSFLKEIKVPQKTDYKKQLISVVYQHVCSTFYEDELFYNGWAFRFVFKEGDNTRASSKHDDYKPIYGKQVYWNLKELMFKQRGTDFIEAGLLWNTVNGASPVAVKIEQKNNLLIVQYYDKDYNKIRRREKEEYVLQKIRNGIPKHRNIKSISK